VNILNTRPGIEVQPEKVTDPDGRVVELRNGTKGAKVRDVYIDSVEIHATLCNAKTTFTFSSRVVKYIGTLLRSENSVSGKKNGNAYTYICVTPKNPI
jgi:hypothetical protein